MGIAKIITTSALKREREVWKQQRKNSTPLKDFYAILGVARNADLKLIRRAFRKLAQDMPPDRNPAPDAKARFQEPGEAYKVLKSEDMRNDYDVRIISEYRESLVGSFEANGKKKNKSELHRILRK